MSQTDQDCKVSKGLDLRLQDLSDLAELLAEFDASTTNSFCFYTSLHEELEFKRVRRGLWMNESHNIKIRTPV